jgi:hypothetical protein
VLLRATRARRRSGLREAGLGEGGPLELSGSDGGGRFLWVQVWHWRRDHYTLTIWGEQISTQKTHPAEGTHVFRFHLEGVP